MDVQHPARANEVARHAQSAARGAISAGVSEDLPGPDRPMNQMVVVMQCRSCRAKKCVEPGDATPWQECTQLVCRQSMQAFDAVRRLRSVFAHETKRETIPADINWNIIGCKY